MDADFYSKPERTRALALILIKTIRHVQDDLKTLQGIKQAHGCIIPLQQHIDSLHALNQLLNNIADETLNQ
jgi:hypothetical protein